MSHKLVRAPRMLQVTRVPKRCDPAFYCCFPRTQQEYKRRKHMPLAQSHVGDVRDSFVS